jgi:hypothetical protein
MSAFGAWHGVHGGLRAGAGGKGRRVTVAGLLRGPGKGGGCAATGPLTPAKGTGPPLRLRVLHVALWNALDPRDHCGPRDRKAAGHTPAPPQGGRRKASPCRP